MFLKLSAASCALGRAFGFSGNLSRKRVVLPYGCVLVHEQDHHITSTDRCVKQKPVAEGDVVGRQRASSM